MVAPDGGVGQPGERASPVGRIHDTEHWEPVVSPDVGSTSCGQTGRMGQLVWLRPSLQKTPVDY